jgi:hypothetical protein
MSFVVVVLAWSWGVWEYQAGKPYDADMHRPSTDVVERSGSSLEQGVESAGAKTCENLGVGEEDVELYM